MGLSFKTRKIVRGKNKIHKKEGKLKLKSHIICLKLDEIILFDMNDVCD